MHLSILIPTHRDSLLVCSRIAQACSWASDDIEVIVRDNSGSAEKRELLGKFQRDNCRMIFAEPCDGLENFFEVLRPAKGEFVFMIADDDFCFDHAIASLPRILASVRGDQSVIGVAGAYAIESSQGTSFATYKNLDSDDVAARLAGYLSYPGPNVLYYSPLRRVLFQRLLDFFAKTLPFYFSYHDQIACLLYLLNGKFVPLPRLLYLYDFGAWETGELAQKRDVGPYKSAGLDPAMNKLHWYLCGFEGAALILNSSEFFNYPRPLRQSLADAWFAAMFARFKRNPRLTFESPLATEAEKLCASLRTSTGQLSFQGMLAEISGFMALTAKKQAMDYFYYWDSLLNKRELDLRKTGT
jgi:hypothetical protein